MQDLCAEYAFPSFTINDADDVDRAVLVPDGIEGLVGGTVRRTVWPKGKAAGAILGTARPGARVVTWKGELDIKMEWDPGVMTDYIERVNILMAAMRTGLEGILNSNHTLTWTPTGLTQYSLVIRYCAGPGGELKFGGSMKAPTFTFTTISADPTISIAA